jgi:hypothetical protein
MRGNRLPSPAPVRGERMLRPATQSGTCAARAEHDAFAFGRLAGKAFQTAGALRIEYFSVCIRFYGHIWKIILKRLDRRFRTFYSKDDPHRAHGGLR